MFSCTWSWLAYCNQPVYQYFCNLWPERDAQVWNLIYKHQNKNVVIYTPSEAASTTSPIAWIRDGTFIKINAFNLEFRMINIQDSWKMHKMMFRWFVLFIDRYNIDIQYYKIQSKISNTFRYIMKTFYKLT